MVIVFFLGGIQNLSVVFQKKDGVLWSFEIHRIHMKEGKASGKRFHNLSSLGGVIFFVLSQLQKRESPRALNPLFPCRVVSLRHTLNTALEIVSIAQLEIDGLGCNTLFCCFTKKREVLSAPGPILEERWAYITTIIAFYLSLIHI